MAGHCVWCFSKRRRDKGKYPSFGRKVFEVIRSSVLWFNCHWSVSNLAVGSFVSMASCRCFGASLKESTVRSSRPVVWFQKDFLGNYCGGVGTRFPSRFLLRQAGTSADIFYTNLEARPRPFVLLCFTSLVDALIQESGQKLRNHAWVQV